MADNDPYESTLDIPGDTDESSVDAAPASPDVESLDHPERIGRYRIEKVLGKGGFGFVYLAYDEQLDRRVAVKVPHARLVSRPEAAEAYLTEARTVANLDHPHIVPVYDVVSTDEFPCYIVSKYVEGTDLAIRLKQSRLKHTEAAELVATVAEALHYAHKQGLVHRDVKPGNILVGTDGKPYVVDFGLTLREESVGKGPNFAGTPDYMSPEQARGEGHRVDGRSDIFSLGVVFYELLVARRPFQTETHQELLGQITTLEARPPRQIDDGIPKELERICLKALSKRATDRYTTAKDLADDLRHFHNSPQRERESPSEPVSVQVVAKGRLLKQLGLSDQQTKVFCSTFLFVDFKGYTERVRILEETAGHRAAAEMRRRVAKYIDDTFQQLEAEIDPAEYQLINTAGDGFFFHFRQAKDAFRFAEALHENTAAHNIGVTDEIAEHWFRIGAATGEAAWDDGEPVGHVVNVASRMQSASTGGDLVTDKATFAALSPEMQQQFKPQQTIHDKHDKSYEVHRTAFGRSLPQLPLSNLSNPSPPVFNPGSSTDGSPLRIVPKGLRSFDEHDADFFLELLPGPRDRDGLPDSIRFWKTRIEETDPDNTFAVGLIYGPSGCGKSSLVKAGLLPRLSDHVIAVSIESTPDETKSRLLHGLRKRCPDLADNLSLQETLAALRRGEAVPAGKKVLIVLDQFEQWLHAKKDEENTELVQALRQCDGGRVQCIVMVRDDFWMAATRFMRELEIRLLEDHNSNAVDLFALRHARKVLTAFGRAFGELPEDTSDTSKEQKDFLKQSIAGLAEEGKVICVRLALFAEMIKGKPWTPTSLKEVGGTEGIGVNFLEETFSASTAPPEHRYHQKAARAVLNALLPGSGSNIKGHMRSYDELLDASGYASRPQNFDDLIRVLDSEIHLITPTDPAGADDDSVSHVETGQKYYQLTHDYLVPSLREWLTRKQKETRKGRAELRLAERSALWNAKPENRHLPSLLEWTSIRTLTDKKRWTQPQRKMMGKAGWLHGLRSAIAAVLLVAVVLGVVTIRNAIDRRQQELVAQKEEEQNDAESSRLVEGLLQADTSQVKTIIGNLSDYREWAKDDLSKAFADSPDDSNAKLHAALAMLPEDKSVLPFLKQRLLTVTPMQFEHVRNLLESHKSELTVDYWQIAKDSSQDPARRFQAACALASYNPENELWQDKQFVEFVAGHLVGVLPSELLPWRNVLRPVKGHLTAPLAAIYRNVSKDVQVRGFTTATLADYLSDDAEWLFDLLADANQKQFAPIFGKLVAHQERAIELGNAEVTKPPAQDANDDDKEALAMRQANAAVMLMRMNAPEQVWPLLRHSPDPRVHCYIIHWLSPLGGDPDTIISRYEQETDVTIKRALVLCLGEFDESRLPASQRMPLIETLLTVYRTDPDAGLHAAAEWLLRKWGQAEKLAAMDKKLQKNEEQLVADKDKKRQWYINGQGQTFVIFDAGEFQMGSPESEAGRNSNERLHERKIGRRFAISTKEVTKAQWRGFDKSTKVWPADQIQLEPYIRSDDSPMIATTWYETAQYCDWLSEQEGIPPDQWCYEVNEQKEYGPGMKVKENFLELSGYRLPTEAEWEFACRAGAKTSRYFGQTETLLPHYAWYLVNGENHAWPVASLKPNDFGLFDMHGNAMEWCYDVYGNYPSASKEAAADAPKTDVVSETFRHLLRGGSFGSLSSLVRSATRVVYQPSYRAINIGFRPSRTYR